MAAGAVLLAVGPALVIINAISSDSLLYMPFATRLGLSVVPACIAAALIGMRHRLSAKVLCVLVGAGLVVMVNTIR